MVLTINTAGYGVPADIVLARPPMNTIPMPQRDQLRHAFEALDEDGRVRVIVLRADGEYLSSGGYPRQPDDFRERVEAFHEKRTPNFTGS